jgi:hypothetical protein
MKFMAARHGIVDIAADFEKSFDEQNQQFSPPDEFLLRMADAATEQLHKELAEVADSSCRAVDPSEKYKHLELPATESLRHLMPVTSSNSISAIVNAAWNMRMELDDWTILQNVENQEARTTEKLRVLRDLVLKSFEIYEFNKRLEGNNAA